MHSTGYFKGGNQSIQLFQRVSFASKRDSLDAIEMQGIDVVTYPVNDVDVARRADGSMLLVVE